MVPPSGTGVAGSVDDGTAPRTIMVSLGTLAAKGFSTAKSPACGAGFSGLPFCANAGTKLAKARINKIAVNFLSMIASLLQAKTKSFPFYTDLVTRHCQFPSQRRPAVSFSSLQRQWSRTNKRVRPGAAKIPRHFQGQ